VDRIAKPLTKKPACSVDGCRGTSYIKGLCIAHYSRLRAKGSVGSAKVRRRAPRGAPLKWLMAHIKHDGDDCLTWPFAKSSTGVAMLRHDGRAVQAARVMCEMVNGPAPADQPQAAHSCGKGHEACVNPKHLRWASAAENAADRVEHGTDLRGEQCHNAKLTCEDVRRIRADAERGVPVSEIARNYPVTRKSIRRVISRDRWGWLDSTEFAEAEG
tara:strand:+ start:697 stop:1341 length:645 start_codon:yes stop_codon:yes gene_type:complete